MGTVPLPARSGGYEDSQGCPPAVTITLTHGAHVSLEPLQPVPPLCPFYRKGLLLLPGRHRCPTTNCISSFPEGTHSRGLDMESSQLASLEWRMVLGEDLNNSKNTDNCEHSTLGSDRSLKALQELQAAGKAGQRAVPAAHRHCAGS